MPVEISSDALQQAEDAEVALVVAQQIFEAAPRIIVRDIDEGITEHITDKFAGRGATRWAPLSGMTIALRKIARGPKRSDAAGRLYYARHAPKISNPYSRRGFGWTGRCKDAALAPGKIEGGSLTRDFRSEGAETRERLVWWHHGTKQKTISPRQRAFFHHVGFHFKKSRTTLGPRPARPIYDLKRVHRISTIRAEKRINDMLKALQLGSPVTFKVLG